MPPRTVIVTAADEKFFSLLQGLLLSIRDKRTADGFSIGVLDVGLTAEQLAWLGDFADLVVVPEWDLQVPDEVRSQRPEMSLTARPFLPKYFPGFDVYLWIDADVWVQEWSGLDLYIAGANANALAATAEVHRAYRPGGVVTKWRYDAFKAAYGVKVAQALVLASHINAGVFALKRDAPHWEVWADCLRQAIENSGTARKSNQMSLNYAVHVRRLPVQLLPATCNWTCNLALPMWDEKKHRYCEPFLPYEPIALMHLTANTKDKEFKIGTTSGKVRKTSLRYPDSIE
jgi:hypothetical protein